MPLTTPQFAFINACEPHFNAPLNTFIMRYAVFVKKGTSRNYIY